MSPDLVLFGVTLAAGLSLELLARHARAPLAAWARGVVMWSGAMWAALALRLLLFFAADPGSVDTSRPLFGLLSMTALSLCVGGAFHTGGFLAEQAAAHFGWRTWVTHALALASSIPSVLAGYALYALAHAQGGGEEPFWRSTGLQGAVGMIGLWLVTNVALFAGVVRMLLNVRLYALEAERARLTAETRAARLTNLEAQLRPHFLYNALGGLAGLIHEHPDRAETMTLALARLLQRSLDAADAAPTLPLRDELDLVRAYLDVEQPRFGDRLTVSFHVEEAVMNAEVPRLTLQPLVENAIKHGLGNTGRAVHIGVAAQREGRRLHLAVSDDGPPFPDDLTGGLGLTSVTERLKLLYDDDFTIRFVNSNGGQAKHVGLILPLTPAS